MQKAIKGKERQNGGSYKMRREDTADGRIKKREISGNKRREKKNGGRVRN